MSNSRQTSGRSGDTFRNLMLYPFELRAQTDHSNQSLPIQASRNPDFYLRAQIRYILANLDSIKPSRVRGKVQDRLRDLARELRNTKGASFWPLTFAAGCLLFMAGLVWFNRPHPLIFSSPTSIRIVRQYDDSSFQLQRVVEGIPQPLEVRHFDEKPLFEPGMTLSWLEVNDRGKFWSVKHIDPWFRLERDYLGWPTLAPNCRQDLEHDHVVCKGEPKW